MSAVVKLRERDGAATRARIEREALRLFAQRGFDATSIRDIAQAVGVADAALYRHFRSKDEIARALFSTHYARLAAAITDIARAPSAFPQKVRALAALFCRLFDDTPHAFTFLLLNQHAHLRFVPADEEANVVGAIRAMMAQAAAQGDIAIADPDLAAAMALGAVVQPGVFALYGRIAGPLARHRDTLAEAALRVLGCRAPA